MALYCPNCDGVLAGGRCQACGWKTGDPVSRNHAVHRLDQSKRYPGYETKASLAPPDDPPGGGIVSGAESTAESADGPEQAEAPVENVQPISDESWEASEIIAKFQQATQKVQ